MKKPQINLDSSIEHNKDVLRLYLQEKLMNVIDDQINLESSKNINASLLLGCIKELRALLGITPPEESVSFEFGINIEETNNKETYDENGNEIEE